MEKAFFYNKTLLQISKFSNRYHMLWKVCTEFILVCGWCSQTTQHQPTKLPYVMVITVTLVFTHLMSI